MSGTINNENNEAIGGITVLLKNTNIADFSDINGRFELSNLKKNEYILEIFGLGFKKQIKTINFSKSKTIHLNILLKEDLTNIEEVTVQGKTKETLIEEKGFSVTSIRTDKLKSQSIEINKILDKTSGVRVRTSGGIGSSFEYRLNGMSGNAIKFFLDEIPMSYYGESYSINNIPVGLIERIDIYKGVVPIKLGSDALGGAINLITKQNVSNFLEGSTSVGSFNTLQSSLNGQWRLKSGFTAKLSFFSTYSKNNYKVWGTGVNYADESTGYKSVEFTKDNPAERFNDDFQNLSAKVDIGFTKTKWADQFFFTMLASDLKKGLQTAQTMGRVFGKVRVNKKTFMPSLIYKKKQLLKKKLDINIFVGYSYNEGVLIDTSTVQYDWRGFVIGNPRASGGEMSYFGKSYFTQKTHSQIYRLNTTYRLPLNFKLGFNYFYEDNRRNGEERFPNEKLEKLAYSAPQSLAKTFVGLSLETLKFNDKLSANLFFKYYGYNASINDLEYTDAWEVIIIKNNLNNWGAGFATSYKISPKFLIKSSVEQATRMPSSTEALGDGVTINNNPFIKPEQSFNLNMGLVFGRYEIGVNHGIKIKINTSYRDTKDRLLFTVLDAQGNGEFRNILKVLSKEIELDITYDFDQKLKFNINGTYSNLRNNEEFDQSGNENIIYRDRLRNEPYLMANAGLEYATENFIQKNSKLYTYFGASYVHQFFLGWPSLGLQGTKGFVPTQLVFDAGVGYTFPSKKLTLALDISNISNEQVYDNYLLQKPGRAFFLKATYQFIKK